MKHESKKCPNCGACQECGRGGYTPVPYPVYPVYPQPTWPYRWPWTSYPQTTWIGNSTPAGMTTITTNAGPNPFL